MFVVNSAGFSYGPFDTADEAAAYAAKAMFIGPWTIAKLRKPASDAEVAEAVAAFKAKHADAE